MKKERIVIGSCKIYSKVFEGALDDNPIKIIADTCVKNNIIGYVKGGASVEYTPTFYKASDDLGLVQKTVITDEDVIIKSGIMTICADTLNQMTSTGRADEVIDSENEKNYRVLKIGGIGNNDGKSYAIVLEHEDPVDGNIYLIAVGKNEAGFTLKFQKNQETVIDAEFKCISQDGEGTLLTYLEEIKSDNSGTETQDASTAETQDASTAETQDASTAETKEENAEG